jgi:hypothetical protein
MRALVRDVWWCGDRRLQRLGRVVLVASVVAVGSALFRLAWDVVAAVH